MTLNVAESLLVVSIGACAYLAAMRLWLGASDQGPSRWAGAWAISAVAFSTARLVQLTTSDPATSVLCARIAVAATPLLLWTLVCFVGSVTGYRPGRGETRIVALITGASAAAGLLTSFFVLPQCVTRVDLSGDPYVSALPGSGIWLAGLESAVAVAWCLGRVVRSEDLSRQEKRVFVWVSSLYAAMGLSTLLSALGFTDGEGVLEYGPLVVSLGISRLLALHQRRLEASLQARVAARSETLRESEARLRRVIEHAPIGFLTVDARGQLEHANAALLAMLGSTREQFASAFNVAEEENAKRSGFSAMFARALERGEVLSAEFEFDSWWGRRLITRTTVSPYRDAAGVAEGALAIVEDITEQRAIEKRLQRAQRLEAVGQLAAGIAHEINNPMAYVRSNLSVLGEELAALDKALAANESVSRVDTHAQLQFLEKKRADSLASVKRTVSIVRDLREFSRTSGNERETVDVNAQLEQAARLASTRADGVSEVEVELREIPPVAIDSGQLLQVLLNLLTQAQQAAGASGHVRATTAQADGCVLISVHDDGPPLRPEQRDRVFEPFAVARGAGEPTLGLYVSQQIVRENDGKLDVLSSEAHGTTFVVRLPVASESSKLREEPAAAS
jgi:PAS domain S-box-containing protein